MWNTLKGYGWGTFLTSKTQLDDQKRQRFFKDLADVQATTKGPILMNWGTDLWAPPDDVVHALRYFRRQGHDVVALHILHPDEIGLPFRGSWTFVDPESGDRTETDAALTRQAYRAAAHAHFEALQDGLRASFIDYQLCDMTRPFDLALSAVLARRRRAG